VSDLVPTESRALFEHPLAAATMAVLRERGYEAASVAEIAARAGVSEEALPTALRKKRRLTLAVSEAYVEDFRLRVGGAFDSEERWPDTLRAAAYETLRCIEEHPDAAWWGTVGVVGVGEMARARRDGVFVWASGLIAAGRDAAPDPDVVSSGTAVLAAGAVVETMGRILQGTIRDDPVDLVPLMMYAAVRPYLGEEAAQAELTIEPPADFRRARHD